MKRLAAERGAAAAPVVALTAWLLIPGCAASGDPPADPPPGGGPVREAPAATATDPARTFADLETRLLQATHTRLEFGITAEGAFTAELDGELVVGQGNDVELDARGTFGGEPVTLSLRTADGRMVGRHGPAGDRVAFDWPVPDSLRGAIVVGLTRMGLLHNLARLVAGAPPDHAGGGVAEWVQARGFTPTGEARRPGHDGVAFTVVVDGQPAGDAELWLDDRGRPVVRGQVVRFPGGEMRVRESYEYRR